VVSLEINRHSTNVKPLSAKHLFGASGGGGTSWATVDCDDISRGRGLLGGLVSCGDRLCFSCGGHISFWVRYFLAGFLRLIFSV